MTQGLAVRNTYTEDYAKLEHPLELLVPWEPGYRIFFRNLFDLILRRSENHLCSCIANRFTFAGIFMCVQVCTGW